MAPAPTFRASTPRAAAECAEASNSECRDAQTAQVDGTVVVERNRHDARVAPVRAGDDVHDEREVLDRAREGADLRARVGEDIDAREVAGERHAAGRRLERGDAAAVRGIAQAAARVAAQADGRATRGDDRGLAAATLAGRARDIVRVGDGAVDGVLVHGVVDRLAEKDAAGRSHARDHRRVVLGDDVLALRNAGGAGHAGDLDPVLDRERHAVQRPERLAAHERLVQLAGPCTSCVRFQLRDGVQLGIDGLDAGEAGVNGLERGEAALADGAGDLGGGEGGDVSHSGGLGV